MRAKLVAQRDDLTERIAQIDARIGGGVVAKPMSVVSHIKCVDCNSVLPAGDYDKCPGCTASPFEFEPVLPA